MKKLFVLALILASSAAFAQSPVRIRGTITALNGDVLSVKDRGGKAVEIHLALGFNNLLFDHPRLPQAVKDEIRAYVFERHAHERAAGETDAQFVYNLRKKSWAGMKQRFFELPADIQSDLMASLEEMFADMFRRMNVADTEELVKRHTDAPVVPVSVPASLARMLARVA